jgi:hypothetical protein
MLLALSFSGVGILATVATSIGVADVLDCRSLQLFEVLGSTSRLYYIQPVVYLYGISSCSIRATQSIQCNQFHCATTFSSKDLLESESTQVFCGCPDNSIVPKVLHASLHLYTADFLNVGAEGNHDRNLLEDLLQQPNLPDLTRADALIWHSDLLSKLGEIDHSMAQRNEAKALSRKRVTLTVF